MTAQVVADGSADCFRDSRQIGQDFLDWLGGEIWPLLHESVEVVDVGRVMIVVMNLHGLGIDVRLECIISIAERRKREGLWLRQCSAQSRHTRHAGEGCGPSQEL